MRVGLNQVLCRFKWGFKIDGYYFFEVDRSYLAERDTEVSLQYYGQLRRA